MELEPPCGSCAVDTLVERHERHAQRVELIEERHQMPQATTQTVEPPTRDYIDTATSNVAHKGIQSLPAIP